MKVFRPYVESLEGLATLSPDHPDDWIRRVAVALNGEPGRELADVLSLRTRRKMGAFFTGHILAQQAIPAETVAGQGVFFDPACGVGDLLLAAARLLPVRDSLQTTLDSWGAQLAGCDTNREFVRAAKARLVLFARQRGAPAAEAEDLDLRSLFPLIQVSDGLSAPNRYESATWIILNPPYGYVHAPETCRWASGKVTEAAVFFEACLRQSATGTRVTAILPDVLRSGTRYEKWRQTVAKQALITRVETYGLFDQNADVDVFILDVIKQPAASRPRNTSWLGKSASRQTTVGDLFAVHVGTVVPHRHHQRGLRVSAPYIHARAIPAWKQIHRIAERRRFNGNLFKPPFVAIRRTSRPEDAHRAIGTMILGRRRVAVENHLIVCKPHDGTIKSCGVLMRLLKSPRTTDWLNTRIRCRHLTVRAIAELPMSHFIGGGMKRWWIESHG